MLGLFNWENQKKINLATHWLEAEHFHSYSGNSLGIFARGECDMMAKTVSTEHPTETPRYLSLWHQAVCGLWQVKCHWAWHLSDAMDGWPHWCYWALPASFPFKIYMKFAGRLSWSLRPDRSMFSLFHRAYANPFPSIYSNFWSSFFPVDHVGTFADAYVDVKASWSIELEF